MHTVNETLYDLTDFPGSLHEEGVTLTTWTSRLAEVRGYLITGCHALYKDQVPTDVDMYTALLDDISALVNDMNVTTQYNTLIYRVGKQEYNLNALEKFIRDKYSVDVWLNLMQGLRSYMLKILDKDNVSLYKIANAYVDTWEFAINTINWK